MLRTILVADDSVTIRRVVELTFSDSPYRVETVGTGAEAIERFDSLRPDLILADVVMPEPSGYEICRHVKRSPRPVPVLLLAGTFEPFDPERALACGADGHVVKPFDSRALVELVERLLSLAREAPFLGARLEEDADDEAEAVLENLAAEGESDSDLPARGDAPPAGGSPEPAAVDPAAGVALPAEAQMDALVRAVIERLSDHVVREIAWDVVPDLAETIIRERLRQLEREEP
jgi:CheY-like chemotaxis protein